MSTQAVSHGHQEQFTTNYYAKNKGPLTMSDDQLLMGSKWENVEFSFPSIPIKAFASPYSHSCKTSLAIFTSMYNQYNLISKPTRNVQCVKISVICNWKRMFVHAVASSATCGWRRTGQRRRSIICYCETVCGSQQWWINSKIWACVVNGWSIPLFNS